MVQMVSLSCLNFFISFALLVIEPTLLSAEHFFLNTMKVLISEGLFLVLQFCFFFRRGVVLFCM